MPTYSYICESDHLTRRVYPIDNVRKWLKCPKCKRRARRDYSRAFGAIVSPGAWPLHSAAMGVQPDQIEEATKDARSRGVPTQFDSQGDAIFTDRGHRKKFLKAYNAHDHDGGYGDG